MKKICLLAFVAFAACNSTPKVEPVKAIPLDEQLSTLDDSIRDVATKIITDSTVLKDSAFKKRFNEMSDRRDYLKKKIEEQENDSTKAK